MSVSKEFLDKINSMLSKNGDMVDQKKIIDLTVGEVYIIKKMVSMTTRFGKSIVVRLYDKTHDATFECFLPKRVVEMLPDGTVDIMNTSEDKYTLTYLGQSSHVFSGGKTRALLNFGTVE